MRFINLKCLILFPAVVCLVLMLSACGEAGDTPPDPDDIKTLYEEALAKMIAKEMTHTGEGPVFSEEEIAEFDRLEEQYNAYKEAQEKIARQRQRRDQYQACMDNQDTVCSGMVRYTRRGDRENKPVMTYGITHTLPEHVTYQYYFGLEGEGCESDGPVNQWTDVDTVTVRYAGEGDIVSGEVRALGLGVRRGQCHLERRLKTPEIIFGHNKNPQVLTFSFKVAPTIDDVMHVCRDRTSPLCQRLVDGKAGTSREPVDGRYHIPGDYTIPVYNVSITNDIPAGIAYQHYFTLSDDCASDGPLNQWTDADSIDVYLVRGSTISYTTLETGKCVVGRQLKFTETDLIISLPDKKLSFSFYAD